MNTIFWFFAFGAYFEQIGKAWFNVRRRDGGVNLCRDSRSFQSNMYHGMKFRRTTVHIRVLLRFEFYVSLIKIIKKTNKNWTQVNTSIAAAHIDPSVANLFKIGTEDKKPKKCVYRV